MNTTKYNVTNGRDDTSVIIYVSVESIYSCNNILVRIRTLSLLESKPNASWSASRLITKKGIEESVLGCSCV